MWHKYNPWGDEVSCTISRSIRERSRSQGSLTFCSRGWGYYNFLLFQQYFFTSMVSGKRISTGLLLAYVTDIWGFSWWVDLYIMRSWRGWSKYIVSILINWVLFNHCIPFQLLVQVKITGISCEEPDVILYHKIFCFNVTFAQCILVEQRNTIMSQRYEALHKCSFRCKHGGLGADVHLLMQTQMMPWVYGLDYSHAQICGVSIQEYTIWS